MTRIVTLLVTSGCSFLLGRLIATSFCLVYSSLEALEDFVEKLGHITLVLPWKAPNRASVSEAILRPCKQRSIICTAS
jgi:hypothetical protein